MTSAHSLTPIDLHHPTDSEDVPVHVAWERVRAGMPAIPKTQSYDAGNVHYKFRGIEQVIEALDELLATHHVFYLPSVAEMQRHERQKSGGGVQYETRLRVHLTIIGPKGDRLQCDAWGEAVDGGDKGTPKATTNAIKNALLGALAIPTEDLARSDTDRNVVAESVAEPDDPFITDEQHLRVVALVRELSEEVRGEIVTKDGKARTVLGSPFVDAEGNKAMHQSQFRSVIEALEAKREPDPDEAPFAPPADPVADAERQLRDLTSADPPPERAHDGKGFDAWSKEDAIGHVHDDHHGPKFSTKRDAIKWLRDHGIPETDERPF